MKLRTSLNKKHLCRRIANKDLRRYACNLEQCSYTFICVKSRQFKFPCQKRQIRNKPQCFKHNNNA